MWEMAKKNGVTAPFNPWALKNDRLELDAAERQRIVAVALDTGNGT